MSNSEKTITINAIIDIQTDTLETIVANETKAARSSKIKSRAIDTAGKIGELISRFLIENDFDSFAKDTLNYTSQKTEIKF